MTQRTHFRPVSRPSLCWLAPIFLALALIPTTVMAQEIPEDTPSNEIQQAENFDIIMQPQLRMNDLAFNDFQKNEELPVLNGNSCDPKTDANHCEWQKESEHFRTIGWGIFGTGAIISGVAAILWSTGFWSLILNDAWEDILSNDEITNKKIQRDEDLVESAYILWGTAAPLVLTGAIILIVEAVKFKPYRKAQAEGQAFQWSPNVIVTPDYQGIGLNMRF